MTDPTEENPVPDKDEMFDRFLEAAPDTALPDIDTNLAPESRAAMDEELRAAAQAVPERTAQALTRVLAENGIGPDGQDGLHSWRCADKVRYPDYCTCVPELVADLLAVVSPDERVARAEATADSMDHLAEVAVKVEARNNELADRLAKARALVTDPAGVADRDAILAILDGKTTPDPAEAPVFVEMSNGNRMWLRSPRDPDTDIVAAWERAQDDTTDEEEGR